MAPSDAHDVVWPTLAMHVMGSLPRPDADRARAHLAQCGRCRDRLSGYAAAVDRLAIAGDGSSPELLHMWESARERIRQHQAEQTELRLAGGEQ